MTTLDSASTSVSAAASVSMNDGDDGDNVPPQRVPSISRPPRSASHSFRKRSASDPVMAGRLLDDGCRTTTAITTDANPADVCWDFAEFHKNHLSPTDPRAGLVISLGWLIACLCVRAHVLLIIAFRRNGFE